MGQKVNPHGMRVGVIKDWDSRWYARDEKVGDLIVEDNKIRKFVKKSLYGAGVPKIEIERSNDVVTLFVHCARPGMVIGKDGAEVEKLRLAVEALIGKKVKLNIVEVRNPDMNAQLVAENIAQQLEKRISHRRANCSLVISSEKNKTFFFALSATLRAMLSAKLVLPIAGRAPTMMRSDLFKPEMTRSRSEKPVVNPIYCSLSGELSL